MYIEAYQVVGKGELGEAMWCLSNEIIMLMVLMVHNDTNLIKTPVLGL